MLIVLDQSDFDMLNRNGCAEKSPILSIWCSWTPLLDAPTTTCRSILWYVHTVSPDSGYNFYLWKKWCADMLLRSYFSSVPLGLVWLYLSCSGSGESVSFQRLVQAHRCGQPSPRAERQRKVNDYITVISCIERVAELQPTVASQMSTTSTWMKQQGLGFTTVSELPPDNGIMLIIRI